MKKTWDPELTFSCRHCIGDGKAAMNVMLALKIWLAEKNKFGKNILRLRHFPDVTILNTQGLGQDLSQGFGKGLGHYWYS